MPPQISFTTDFGYGCGVSGSDTRSFRHDFIPFPSVSVTGEEEGSETLDPIFIRTFQSSGSSVDNTSPVCRGNPSLGSVAGAYKRVGHGTCKKGSKNFWERLRFILSFGSFDLLASWNFFNLSCLFSLIHDFVPTF